MTKAQRLRIARAHRSNRALFGADHRDLGFHFCLEAGIMVFADLHRKRAQAERAVRA